MHLRGLGIAWLTYAEHTVTQYLMVTPLNSSPLFLLSDHVFSG